jgi:hypothetical protein
MKFKSAYKNSNKTINSSKYRQSRTSNKTNNHSSPDGHTGERPTNIAKDPVEEYLRDVLIADDEGARNKVKEAKSAGGMPPGGGQSEATQEAINCGIRPDKLALDLPKEIASAGDLDGLEKRLKGEGFKRLSAKSKFYRRNVVYRLPSRAVVDIAWEPVSDRCRHALRITINPSNIEEGDIAAFKKLLRTIFILGGEAELRHFLCYRLDVCVDKKIDLDTIIVRQKGAAVEKKYVWMTDANGRIQTLYLGSVQSAEHSIVYDQNAADEFKRRVGEKVSTNESEAQEQEKPKQRRPESDAQDAELHVGRTRFEVRRVFKEPVRLADLGDVAALMDKLEVFLVSPSAFKSDHKRVAFTLYLESVRLRGLIGARKYLRSILPSKKADIHLREFERRLGEYRVSWWSGEQSRSLLDVLRETPSWHILQFAAQGE